MKKIAAERNYRMVKKASVEWSLTDGGCNYYGRIMSPEEACRMLARAQEISKSFRHELVELRKINDELLKENESLKKD
jgi:hypothetical protein